VRPGCFLCWIKIDDGASARPANLFVRISTGQFEGELRPICETCLFMGTTSFGRRYDAEALEKMRVSYEEGEGEWIAQQVMKV
jgi:hypothetical protein